MAGLTDQSVSVVIPTYNRARFIAGALESVLSQSHGPGEIIVVDDGSTDETEAIVDEFTQNGVRYLSHEQNRGAPAARNTGIAEASGTFIEFLDSDDRWRPEKLERQLNEVSTEDEEPTLVYTGQRFYDAQSGALVRVTPPAPVPEDPLREILDGDFIGSTSVGLVHATTLRTVGGFTEGLSSRQDWDLWIRLIRERPIVRCADGCLVHRLIGHEQITSDVRTRLQGVLEVVDMHRELFEQYPRTLAHHLAFAAAIALNYGRWEGWRLGMESLEYHPLQPRLWAALLTSLFGKRVYRTLFRWNYREDYSLGGGRL